MIKHLVDYLAIVVTLGTIINVLPAVAAFFSIIWTLIRIYETRTFQRFLRRDLEIK